MCVNVSPEAGGLGSFSFPPSHRVEAWQGGSACLASLAGTGSLCACRDFSSRTSEPSTAAPTPPV